MSLTVFVLDQPALVSHFLSRTYLNEATRAPLDSTLTFDLLLHQHITPRVFNNLARQAQRFGLCYSLDTWANFVRTRLVWDYRKTNA